MSVLYQKVFPIFYISLSTFLKICASMIFVTLLLVPCVLFFDVGVPTKLRQSQNSTQKEIKVKTILYWTSMFSSKTFYFGEGDQIFRGCEISACRATPDRNLMRIEEFDAILFHGVETNILDLPAVRSPSQKYVFVEFESPVTHPLDTIDLPDDFYNWTITYGRNSDIPRTYAYIINSTTKEIAYPVWARPNNTVASDVVYEDVRPPRNKRTFKGKRKTAAWFVSNCHTASLRNRYASELQKYTDIDIYGKCGSLSCESGNKKCYQMLESRYYFYLAFENSLCVDYVTEKLFKTMNYNIVPIVYGGANYSEFVPPGSYINIADFKNPKHLAKYLNYLMENPEEYVKFFWWKKHFFIDSTHRQTLCKICKMLHDEKSLAPSSIPSVKKWWSEGKCRNPLKILKKIMST